MYIQECRLNDCVSGNTSRAGEGEIQERPELRECSGIDAGKHTLNTRRHALGDGERSWRGLFDIPVERRVAQYLGRSYRRGRRGATLPSPRPRPVRLMATQAAPIANVLAGIMADSFGG